MSKGLISIVVPCYNEEKTINLFMTEISKIEKEMKEAFNVNFEYIFVDDGSKDTTATILKELEQKISNFNYILLSRNFGKESALYAGLKASKGDYVAVMDVDLQDPPELLKEMYTSIINEDYDCAATRRTTRKGETIIRSICARMFYKLINKISTTEIVDGARDYRLMKRNMVDAILSVSEYNRFSKGIFSWVGFKTKWLEYVNKERAAGETKWSFWKLFIYSLDGIVAFTTAPLAISSVLGLAFCIIAFIMIIFFLVKTLMYGDPVVGFPTLIGTILLVSGVQLFCLGIHGQYIAKTYLETKNRPIYIVKEKSNKLQKD